MNFIKRAVLSVTARKGKSFLQIFIFSVICVLVLSGLAIQSAANKSAEMARQSLGGIVTLQLDMEKMLEERRSGGGLRSHSGRGLQREPVLVEDAEQLITYQEVIGYNFVSSSSAISEELVPIDLNAVEEDESTQSEEESIGSMFMGGGSMRSFGMGDFSVEGIVFSDSARDFMEDVSNLVDGRHITEADLNDNVVMVEQLLAEENGLTVGDSITLLSVDEENTFDLEVIGIYQTTDSGAVNDFGFSFTAMTPYNKLYVPYTVANGLKGAEYAGTIDSAVFYMDDPVNIERFVTRAQEESTINFEVFALDANDRLYQQMMGPINNVASFSENIVYLVTIAGAIILGLIVMISIRERKYEMGVLLALGEKRSKLIGQFLVEIVVVAMIALGIASVTGNFVANQVGEQLLNQQLQVEETSSSPDSFRDISSRLGIEGGFGGLGGLGGSQAEPIDELVVEITANDIGMLALIGLMIAIVSTLIPSLSVLRLQPKTILTKQD
jgi:putative ABC transport system permease protein